MCNLNPLPRASIRELRNEALDHISDLETLVNNLLGSDEEYLEKKRHLDALHSLTEAISRKTD